MSDQQFMLDLVRAGKISAFTLVDVIVKIMEQEGSQSTTVILANNHNDHDEMELTLDDWKTIRAAVVLSDAPTKPESGGGDEG